MERESHNNNFNSLETPGIYFVGGNSREIIGFPEGLHEYGILIVFKAKNYISQLYMPYSDQSENKVAFRTGDNNFSTSKWLIL